MTCFTQGLSSSAGKSAHNDWREVALWRIGGNYGRLTNSPRTIAAETGLGLEKSAYWFLARVETLYGRVLMVWVGQPPVANGAVASPFDTGAVWHDKYAVHPPFADSIDKREFIRQWTLSAEDAEPMFREWVRDAFVHSYEYVAGVGEPTFVLHDRIVKDIDKNAAFAWSWELRVPPDALPSEDLRLAAVFWQETDYRTFLAFARAKIPGEDEFGRFLTLVGAVSRVFPSITMATQQARAYVASETPSGHL